MSIFKIISCNINSSMGNHFYFRRRLLDAGIVLSVG